MNSWHSYPSIFALGHRAVADLFSVPVCIEEKCDGSQFSFGKDESGVLYARSRGKELDPHSPQEKMFAIACETVVRLAPDLHPGWTYRGEYLRTPKHNSLTYSRVPKQHIILFDVNDGHESYLSYEDKAAEASRLGLEVVPLLDTWRHAQARGSDALIALLDTESVLGGAKIEGVVIKPASYDLLAPDKKVLMGKFVSEAFKELHQREWKVGNPGRNDVVESISASMRTDARWRKAVERLRDDGALEQSPRDIGKLVQYVGSDLDKECREHVSAALMKHFWPQIQRRALQGLPEWYKKQLLSTQFSEASNA